MIFKPKSLGTKNKAIVLEIEESFNYPKLSKVYDIVKTKNASSSHMQLLLTLVAALALLIAVSPSIFGRGSIRFSNSSIPKEINETENPKVLLLGSWNDYYSIEYNSFWRQEMGEKFVERDYEEVLDAASYGDELFNQYLNSKRITHLLVPRESFDNDAIYHKFGTRGTIDIQLSTPYFEQVGYLEGPNSAVLLRVLNPHNSDHYFVPSSYKITWKNVDTSFYSINKKTEESGLYRLLYSSSYENGPNVSWFFAPESDEENFLEIAVESLPSTSSEITLSVTLAAAYGPNAPSHTISLKTLTHFEKRTLEPSNPETFEVVLQRGDTMEIRNITPCRLPRTFEPSDLDTRRICFGVTKVSIHP